MAHFSELFGQAKSVSQDDLAAIRRELRILAPVASEDPSTSMVETPRELGEDDSLASVPLSFSALKAIEDRLEDRLQDDLVNDTFSVGRQQAETLDVEQIAENRYFEDMQLRLRMVFGEPVPDRETIATIFAHKSAHVGLRTVTVSDDLAGIWRVVGKNVLEAVVTILVYRGSKRIAGGELINAKATYICASNHPLKQMHDNGLAQIIVGRALTACDSDNRAIKSGITNIG